MQKPKILKYLNKYLIAILVFVAASLFLIPESSWIERVKYRNKISKLEDQIKKKKQEQLELLKQKETLQDSETLEQLAREKYHMVKENEEVFLIKE